MTRDQALVYRLIQNSLDEGYIAFSHEARAGQTKVPSQERTDEAWMRFVENNTITFTALAVALGEERCQAVGAMAFTLFQAGVASAFNPELDRKDVWRATRHEVIILIRNMDIR